MPLNYLAMIFADKIINIIGLSPFLLIGWIFAVMQAVLWFDLIIEKFQALGVIPLN